MCCLRSNGGDFFFSRRESGAIVVDFLASFGRWNECQFSARLFPPFVPSIFTFAPVFDTATSSSSSSCSSPAISPLFPNRCHPPPFLLLQRQLDSKTQSRKKRDPTLRHSTRFPDRPHPTHVHIRIDPTHVPPPVQLENRAGGGKMLFLPLIPPPLPVSTHATVLHTSFRS